MEMRARQGITASATCCASPSITCACRAKAAIDNSKRTAPQQRSTGARHEPQNTSQHASPAVRHETAGAVHRDAVCNSWSARIRCTAYTPGGQRVARRWSYQRRTSQHQPKRQPDGHHAGQQPGGARLEQLQHRQQRPRRLHPTQRQRQRPQPRQHRRCQPNLRPAECQRPGLADQPRRCCVWSRQQSRCRRPGGEHARHAEQRLHERQGRVQGQWRKRSESGNNPCGRRHCWARKPSTKA